MAPPAARRAATTVLRTLAAACRSPPARSLTAARRARPALSSLPRSTPLTRVASTARSFFSCTARPAATRSSAAVRAAILSARCGRFSTTGARRFSTTGARRFSAAASSSRSAARYKVRRHLFKPPHRRFSQSSIPPELKKELDQIEADGLTRHQELRDKMQNLTTKVADSMENSKRLKIEYKWQMAKTALGVCTTVLGGAALSGYVILNFLKSGWGKAHNEAAEKSLQDKMAKLKLDLNTDIDRALDIKEKEETSKREETKRALDLRESAVAAREEAMAAKEAAALEGKGKK